MCTLKLIPDHQIYSQRDLGGCGLDEWHMQKQTYIKIQIRDPELYFNNLTSGSSLRGNSYHNIKDHQILKKVNK